MSKKSQSLGGPNETKAFRNVIARDLAEENKRLRAENAELRATLASLTAVDDCKTYTLDNEMAKLVRVRMGGGQSVGVDGQVIAGASIDGIEVKHDDFPTIPFGVVARGEVTWQTAMTTCPVCHNKRCPKAMDERMKCTRSNEPNQVGEPESPQLDDESKLD